MNQRWTLTTFAALLLTALAADGEDDRLSSLSCASSLMSFAGNVASRVGERQTPSALASGRAPMLPNAA